MLTSSLMGATSTYDFGKFDGTAEDAATVCVLTNPNQYVGKKVRIIGVYFHDFETSNLFFSRDALEAYDVSSAIGLPVLEKLLPASVSELESLNGCLVAVEGVVYSDGARLSLKEVTRIFLKGRGPAKATDPSENGKSAEPSGSQSNTSKALPEPKK